MRSVRTEDGYTFYEQKDGRWSDHKNIEKADIIYDSTMEFMLNNDFCEKKTVHKYYKKVDQKEIGDLLNFLLCMGHVDTIVINADNGIRYTIDLADNNRNCESQDFLVTEEPIQPTRY